MPTVGEANGWQAILFKLNMIVLPIFVASGIGFGTWVVGQLHGVASKQGVIIERQGMFSAKLEQATSDHYSVDAARADRLELRQSILDEIASKYPPRYLREQVNALEDRVGAIESKSGNVD